MKLPSSSRVRSHGITLCVRRIGSGPRVLALHGGPGLDHHLLVPLALRLARRFEVWLPDLPGHGRSAPESGELPGLIEILESTESWIGALRGGTDVLLGHSLGAWLVREILRRGAVCPRLAVLVSPPAAGLPKKQAQEAPARIRPRPGEDEENRAGFEDLLSHMGREMPGGVPAAVREALAQARIRPLASYPRFLQEWRRAVATQLSSFDPPCDVRVVCGERDSTTPPAQASTVARAVQARLVLVPRTGHYLPVENPDAISEFLREPSDPA